MILIYYSFSLSIPSAHILQFWIPVAPLMSYHGKAKGAQWFLNVAATGHTQLPLAISETWQHKATVVTRRETKHSGNSISMLGACQQLCIMFHGRQIGSQNGVAKGANCLSAGLACISWDSKCTGREMGWPNCLICPKMRRRTWCQNTSAVVIWHFLWRRMIFISFFLMSQKLKDPVKSKVY